MSAHLITACFSCSMTVLIHLFADCGDLCRRIGHARLEYLVCVRAAAGILAGKRGGMRPGRILESAELLAGWPPAPGALARMPRLRWIQSLSVGMSTWLKRSDLRQEG